MRWSLFLLAGIGCATGTAAGTKTGAGTAAADADPDTDAVADPDAVADAVQRAQELERRAAAAPSAAAWEAAARAFGRVAGREAARAAVEAWRQVLTLDPGDPEAGMTGRDEAVVDAYLHLADLQTGDDRALALFLAGKYLWRRGESGRAERLFDRIVEKHPNATTAEYAANLLLDSLIRRRAYDDVETAVDLMLANKPLLAGRPELSETLRRIQAAAARRRAEQLEKNGDLLGAARAYLDLANDPKSPKRDELLYNAGACFEAAGEPAGARAAWSLLVRSMPSSHLAARAQTRLRRLAP